VKTTLCERETVAGENKHGLSDVPTKAIPRLCKPCYASWNVALSWDRPQRVRQEIVPRVLKAREAAAYIGVSPWTIRNLVHEGVLEYLPGKHWRFSTDDLDEYIRRNREKEPAL
jgi:excisionase family DNA binding protein